MDEETRRIHRLLSDGKLSGPEAEEILENVLAAVAREKRRPVSVIRYLAGAGTVLAAAAAVLLFVNVGRDPGGDVSGLESGEVSPLRVSCSGGELSACPASSKLVFSGSGKRATGFLSAYAELLGHDPKRTFLYSKEDGSPQVPAQSAARPLGLPGRYRVHAVIADRPLTREELVEWVTEGARRAGIRARLQVEIVVTE